MDRHRRTNVELDGTIEARSIAGTLGRELRVTCKRRGLTQAALGRRVGLSRARISELQRGEGATAPLAAWVKLGKAIDRPLAVSFSRAIEPDEPRDAGHLAAQELVLGLARRHGRRADFELPTRPTDPARSIDVAIRDDDARAIIVVEIWNRLDDLGAAARATTRKVAEADGPAALTGGDGPPYRVATCWLFVDTAANRRLVTRYPEILQSRFPGSSIGWVRCLTDGLPPPNEPGLAWIDPRAGRIVPVRHRRPSAPRP
jgi:transcriptional regulator with XRE-family HTH domain